jgi:hypothetical protein
VCLRRTTHSSLRMLPSPGVELRVGRGNNARRDPQDGVERVHWVEPTIEAEHVFVQVRLQVLRLDPPVMRAVQPGLQVAEDEVDHWQVLLGVVRIADHRERVVCVAVNLAQVAVSVVCIRPHLRPPHDVRGDERNEGFRAAIAHHGQTKAAGVDLPARADLLVLADLDGSYDERLVVDALAFAACGAANETLVNAPIWSRSGRTIPARSLCRIWNAVS